MSKRVVILCVVLWGMLSCNKNDLSNIPLINLIGIVPNGDFRINVDTAFIYFRFADGDADIFSNDTQSAIFVRDTRYDTFNRYDFPYINDAIRDPKKGFKGTCVFYIYPAPIPRLDSLHIATGDTTSFEFYIRDKAGNISNSVTTSSIYMKR